MFFIGIDIGKRHHEVALIDEKGNVIGKTIRITNTKHGSEKLTDFFNKYNLTPNNTLIGMEATGHYWLSVYSFLNKLDFSITTFNHIQSDVLRDFYIRKTKTDTVDEPTPKVRFLSLTFGGFFVWQNTVLNLNLNLFMTTYLVKEV